MIASYVRLRRRHPESVISAEIAIKIAATLEAAWEANIRRPAFHRNDPAGTEGAPAG